MEPIISVIVPVYNVENYLWTCLDSLAAQTQEGIEILLIDDGSTDQSGEICDQYANNDPRFRVYHTDNHGLGAARNYGIDRARGRYLMFVDSDDWVERDLCETSLNVALKQSADMVIFSAAVKGVSYTQNLSSFTPFPGFQTREKAMAFCLHGPWTVSWNKLYARELFHEIRFPENRLYEDIGTLYKLIWKARKIWYMDRILYHYRVRKGSIRRSVSPRLKRDYFLMALQRARDLQKWNYEPEKMEMLAVKHALDYCRTVGEWDRDSLELAERTIRESNADPPYLTETERELMETLRG